MESVERGACVCVRACACVQEGAQERVIEHYHHNL